MFLWLLLLLLSLFAERVNVVVVVRVNVVVVVVRVNVVVAVVRVNVVVGCS